MPLEITTFRVSCGLFLWRFAYFMWRRAKTAAIILGKVRARKAQCVLLAVIISSLLMCAGDIELNPGPLNGEIIHASHTTDHITSNYGSTDTSIPDIPVSQHLVASASANEHHTQTGLVSDQPTIQSISSTLAVLSTSLSRMEQSQTTFVGTIHTQLRGIEDSVTQQISQQIQTSYQSLIQNISRLQQGIDSVKEKVLGNERRINKLAEENELLKEKMDEIITEMDKLEAVSRRKNIRLFGIQESTSENYTECSSKVISLLNELCDVKSWCAEDIERAHRLGFKRTGDNRPRPMIVQFHRWSDKMVLLSDKNVRDKLRTAGIKVASDLTRLQANNISKAREEGKFAFYKNGQLYTEPRRTSPRIDNEAGVNKTVNEDGKYTTDPGHPGADTLGASNCQEYISQTQSNRQDRSERHQQPTRPPPLQTSFAGDTDTNCETHGAMSPKRSVSSVCASDQHANQSEFSEYSENSEQDCTDRHSSGRRQPPRTARTAHAKNGNQVNQTSRTSGQSCLPSEWRTSKTTSKMENRTQKRTPTRKK